MKIGNPKKGFTTHLVKLASHLVNKNKEAMKCCYFACNVPADDILEVFNCL